MPISALETRQAPPKKAPKVTHRTRGRPKAEAAPVPKSGPPVDVTPGCRQECLSRIKAGPKTSAELIQALPNYTSASVYLALKELRGAMLIETRDVEGQNKNVFVGG